MKPRVVITERLDTPCADWLAQHADVVWHKHDQPNLAATLRDAEGLVVRTYTLVNDGLLDQAPNLRVVGRAGVGLDNIDVPACRKRGVEVVYTPDANTQAVVEYVMGLMLDHVRRRTPLPSGADAETFHGMRTTQVGRQLSELTLGIVGYGRIGKRLSKAALAIGMDVLACDVLPEDTARNNEPAGNAAVRFVDHETLYRSAGIVSLHADGRSSNRHLINTVALEQLKPTALLINAARGVLIDHAALHGWLLRTPTARAMLDVHDPEPPPADLALYHLPNCTLLPHLASRTHAALANMSWVVRDVWSVLKGNRPTFTAP